MGNKNKLQRFEENRLFQNLFQYTYEQVVKGFPLKGNWHHDFFHNNNEIVLELGCGKGEYTIGLARKYPEKNFIGIDIKGARLWRGLKSAEEEGLKNVAFIRTRIDLIEYFFDSGEISEIWITFPDPQIKSTRERKRLTSPLFLNRYARIMKPDGIVHLKTDALLLYDYTKEVVDQEDHELIYCNEDVYHSDLQNEVTQIQTFYEKMWLSYNTPIRYMKFRLKTSKD
ncbi:MAG: tRNA (guanosine(46)-N7)-methyltransferase TrmB [Bacteroidales bacterium]|nr:tRNA (guanosine(46)-N7)-methyltransferase TrmB [Bacteroidales bacterium]